MGWVGLVWFCSFVSFGLVCSDGWVWFNVFEGRCARQLDGNPDIRTHINVSRMGLVGLVWFGLFA
jgi:hypothetical protein